MFVVKDPKYLRNLCDEDNPTQSPTFLLFDSGKTKVYNKQNSYKTVGTNIIGYLLEKMDLNHHLDKVPLILDNYGYAPEGMYNYVLYNINQ